MASRRELAKYSSVPLPPLIPCSQCKIQKKPDQYSANRLKDLQKQIIMTKGNKKSFNPKSDPFVACSLCKGGAAVEHECYHCAITYPRTDKYFAKNMLKMRKDEALCWTCSQRQQNDTLSSSDEEEGSSGSDTSFVTNVNPYQDTDAGSTVNDSTSTSRGNGFSSTGNSSGGVSLNGHGASGTTAGTPYAGTLPSHAGSSHGAPTSGLSSLTISAGTSSGTGTSKGMRSSASVASSGAGTSGGRPNGFNPRGYGYPGSPSSTRSAASGSQWARIRPPPTILDTDSARELEKEQRRLASKKADDDVQVSDDDSD